MTSDQRPEGDETQAEAEDKALLGAIAAKNEAAFEQLYKRYYCRLLQFVGRMVRDRRLAEETVDDALFAVWKSAARYEGRSRVSTWMFGIAYRRALKTLESNKRHAIMDGNDEWLASTASDDPDANPEARLASRQLQVEVSEGIDQLSEEHRAVVLLTAMGHSYADIGLIVQCPANTVKTRMFYARKKLRHLLSPQTISALSSKRYEQPWPHRVS